MIFFCPNTQAVTILYPMKSNPRQIRIEDYSYQLPDEHVPLFPPAVRGQSNLVVYQSGEMHKTSFVKLAQHLPDQAMLVFNQSRVIPARLVMHRASGARIEVFLLQPFEMEHQGALQSRSTCTWSCLVGGAKKWKENEVLELNLTSGVVLRAHRIGRTDEYFNIQLEWTGDVVFAEILEMAGKIPLPPYLKRESTAEDNERYQTVYARLSGSVAAPTAGLHFTDHILTELQAKGHPLEYLTLHVGAGTFKPVSADTMEGHHMHVEHFVLSKDLIQAILNHGERPIIPVGTTSMRTLESLYWLGVQCLQNPELKNFHVDQWQAYDSTTEVTREHALRALLERLSSLKIDHCDATTGILIAPGYGFHLCDGLITNFHQPQSTLLLLVAALIGEKWRDVYQFALNQDIRFLSYGDSSLLIP
jgi:S-adenosylmethionine:tRNA ribosyltransferase-isomerase